MRLSILCVTRAEDVMLPNLRVFASLAERCKGELVLGADGQTAADRLANLGFASHKIVLVSICEQAPESVFDYCIERCQGEFIIRFDDDERPSPKMATWLEEGGYRQYLHWRFHRAHLWGNEREHLSALWPDYQTRLSERRFAGGRFELHQVSPYGLGELGPGAILHYKFLLRSVEDRGLIADRYERIRQGTGRGYKFGKFQLPECALPEMTTMPFVDPVAA